MIYTFVADHYQYLACPWIIALLVETLLWLVRTATSRVLPTDRPIRLRRLIQWSLAAPQSLRVPRCFRSAWPVSTRTRWRSGRLTPNTVRIPLRSTFRLPSRSWRCSRAITRVPSKTCKNPSAATPTICGGYYRLGLYYQDSNQPAEAASFFAKAVLIHPDILGTHHLLARDLDQSVTFPGADAPPYVPISPGADFLHAQTLQKQGLIDQAIAGYLADLRLHPGHAESYRFLGDCYWLKNNLPAAIDNYYKSIHLFPRYAEAWFDLGLALCASGEETEGMAALLTAREIDPDLLTKNPGLVPAISATLPSAAR